MKISLHSLLCTSTLLTAVLAASYFIPIDQHWDATPVYLRHHGYALVNHVIKTLEVFFIECLEACQENMHCFSFNYIKLSSGVFRCQLNRSNKNQRRNSYFTKLDWQYVEPKEKKLCHLDNCSKTNALPNGWYRLGASKYKLIKAMKTWQDARERCKSLGGGLFSAPSELAASFLTGLFDLRSTLAKCTLDGTDDNLSLINGASIQTIGKINALYLNGQKKATVPNIDITERDFTMAIWIKCSDASHHHSVISNNPQSNILWTIIKGSLQIELRFQGGSKDSTRFSIDSYLEYWFHVAVTWNSETRKLNIYVNGTHMDNITAVSNNLQQSGKFLLGTRGNYIFEGWMRELLVVPNEMSPSEIRLIKDKKLHFGGVWTGLNDITTEAAFKLSNEGSPDVSVPPIVSNKDQNDCVMLTKKGNSPELQAVDCLAKKEFICEVPL